MTAAALAAAIGSLAGGSAAAARAAEVPVGIPGKYFTPSDVEIVAGDTVTWHNGDHDVHDLVADDGEFASPLVYPDSTFAHEFDAVGQHPYVCTIHPYMTGVVDVVPIALSGPASVPVAGARFTLEGRAPVGVPEVAIESAPTPDGAFSPVRTVATAPDGSFSAALPAEVTAAWRAVADGRRSPSLVVSVAPRLALTVAARRTASLVVLSVRTRPARLAETVALELYSRERFAWVRVGRARLDGEGRITFSLRRGLRRLARVVYAADGAEVRSRPIALWRIR